MKESTNRSQPIALLPEPLEGYGLPDSKEKLLAWNFVSKRMVDARNYWVCTVSSNQRPHARPVWGVWIDETLFFGGGSGTKWSRNLRADPQVSVNLEDGNESVIFEGRAKLVDDATLMKRLVDAYEAKYNIRHGPSIWQLYPDRAFAWRSMDTMTKFVFE